MGVVGRLKVAVFKRALRLENATFKVILGARRGRNAGFDLATAVSAERAPCQACNEIVGALHASAAALHGSAEP